MDKILTLMMIKTDELSLERLSLSQYSVAASSSCSTALVCFCKTLSYSKYFLLVISSVSCLSSSFSFCSSFNFGQCLLISHCQWWILGEANEAAALGPPLFGVVEGPLLKMTCVVLGYFVTFWNGSLVSTTVKVLTKSGYFAFDGILPLQAILPFNICVSSKLAYLLQCS